MRVSRSVPFVVASSAVLLASLSGCESGPASTSAKYAVIDGEHAPVPDIQMGDAKTINAILDEGMNRNQVMDHLETLSARFGPRLTGSSAADDAGMWARDQMTGWGLSNSHISQWGEIAVRFDRGPSSGTVWMITGENDDGSVKEQNIRELQFSTLAWVKGTDGPARGPVVRMPATEAQFEADADNFAGAWILIPTDYVGAGGIRSVGSQMRARHAERGSVRQGEAPEVEMADAPVAPGTERWTGSFMYGDTPIPLIVDFTREDGVVTAGTMSITGFHTGPITEIVHEPDAGAIAFEWEHAMGISKISLEFDDKSAAGFSQNDDNKSAISLDFDQLGQEPTESEGPSILARVLAAKPLGFISSSKDDRVWTTSMTGWRDTAIEDYASDVEVNIASPDFDFINSRLADGAPIELEFNLDHILTAGPIPCYNTIAEIRGSELPDEIVIMSAHLDSWNGPGSTGTIDNGTGSSVTLEAARILAAVGAQPKRTIRFILWTGEEQGLLGSRGYVAQLSEEELDNISAVFVDDGGTNTQGGIPAADFMVPMLAAATANTNGRFYSETDGKFLDVNVRPTGDSIKTHGGSDHASFNAVGVPGFFFDEVGRANYRHGWHTQFDQMDQAIPEYLRQSATNAALTIYNIACAPTLLPREAEADSTSASADSD